VSEFLRFAAVSGVDLEKEDENRTVASGEIAIPRGPGPTSIVRVTKPDERDTTAIWFVHSTLT
jgi:hypothetical protein